MLINTLEELMDICGYESEASIDWREVSKNQKLSESFIREFKERLDWIRISRYQKLSEDFIREFQDSVYWMWISFYQKLSEDFIREFKDSVDWEVVSEEQKLSESFIREFKEYVDWFWISSTQELSKAFIEEFKDYYREPEEGRVLISEFYCGIENRVITIYSKEPTKIRIGCFVGTQAEALKAIAEKYGNSKEASEYCSKVNKCFDFVNGVDDD